VLAAVVDEATAEQLADDLDGFGEHLVPHVHRAPAPPDDVLVEVLAGAEAEREAALRQQTQRGGLLGHDRGMVTKRGAGHVGHQLDP